MALLPQKTAPTISPTLRQKVADEAWEFNNAPEHQIGTPDPARIRFKNVLEQLTEDDLCDIEVLFRITPLDHRYDSFADGWADLAAPNGPYPTVPARIEDIIAHSLEVSNLK